MHWLDEGAYTGETSPVMLTAIGVTHVLIGHSERRQYFNETDDTVNLKLKAALAHGLVPIVCVGETARRARSRPHRKSSNSRSPSRSKASTPRSPLPSSSPTSPSGPSAPAAPPPPRSPTKPTRSSARRSPSRSSPALAASTRILYGGSVKPDNAAALCCLEDIDGALVGGASLEPESFAKIVRNATPK